MNLDTYSALRGYTIVASAMETTLDTNDELDGAFIWVVYDSPNSTLSVGRLDVMSGVLRSECMSYYRNAREYATCFAEAMAILYEKATGRDFNPACPRN